ncbi:MAG TPA: hypothetical protein VFR67_07840 [Pilimelia sp.]|nr:hypothetical protein [Pilimelia sp.]
MIDERHALVAAEPERKRGADHRTRRPIAPAWRECSLTRTRELQALLAHLCGRDATIAADPLAEAAAEHLRFAEAAATGRIRPWASITGSVMERARSNQDAAEANLLRLSPAEYLLGQLPSLLSHVRRHLAPTDPRRDQFERIAAKHGVPARQQPAASPAGAPISEDERGTIISAVRAASSEALRRQRRIRSFRNVLLVTAAALAMIALGIVLIGFLSPETIPLCFMPESSGRTMVVCPTGQAELPPNGSALDVDAAVKGTAGPHDLFVVEALGLAAAAGAAAAALRGIRGSSEPYGLPVALALLKLPLGALTAVLGLLLMRGQFVPGLTALDTTGQILAWGLVFGYGQQLFTQLVDRQAHSVLDAVKGSGPRDGRPTDPAARPDPATDSGG